MTASLGEIYNLAAQSHDIRIYAFDVPEFTYR